MRQIGPTEPVDALKRLVQFLGKYGFRPACDVTAQRVSLVHNENVGLDIGIWETSQIVGILGRKRLRLSDSYTDPLTVQVSLVVNNTTHKPLFIPLPASYTPEFLIENVLNALRTLTYMHPEGATQLELGRLFPDQFPEAKRLSNPE